MNFKGFFGIFMDKLSDERIEWLKKLIPKKSIKDLFLFFTGSALYSNTDVVLNSFNINIENSNEAKIYFDTKELNIFGLHNLGFQYEKQVDIFKVLLNNLKRYQNENKIGFFQFEGPYMSRKSIYGLNLLKKALKYDLEPELYLYLDGLHMVHKHQKPSEFENILNSIEMMAKKIDKKYENHVFLGCSRCATARGYVDEVDSKGNFLSSSSSEAVKITNLKNIVERFTKNLPIFSANSINIVPNDNKLVSYSKPVLTTFITRDPYTTEYPFGGLSFALACANQGIETNVVFIEDGVYCLVNDQKVTAEDKVFNINEVIEATNNDQNINYYIYGPSVQLRKLDNSSLMNLDTINGSELHEKINKINNYPLHRMIIF